MLVRSERGAYAMAAEGTVTGADLVRLGDGWLRSSIPGGGLIGTLAGSAPLGSKRLPVTIEIELHSEPEGLRVGTGGGSVAGYPAGPHRDDDRSGRRAAARDRSRRSVGCRPANNYPPPPVLQPR